MPAPRVFCNQCKKLVDIEDDDAGGFSCCSECGTVVSDLAFSSDVQFTKDASGAAAPSAKFIKDGTTYSGRVGRDGREYGPSVESHEKSIEKGRVEIVKLINSLDFREARESYEVEALHLYRLALDKGFTKGRRITMVAAACLYTICRKHSLPYLLMDFSDATGINVYILGGVYVSLCSLLCLDTLEAYQRPVDPALYMHRYASRLGFGDKGKQVSDTATRIVSSMKRDWIHTGRRPSGVCGAALLIAAHIHGFQTTRRQVISVVHIGASTLGKRVDEFGATRAGDLTVADFNRRSREQERLLRDYMSEVTAQRDSIPEADELLCVHIQNDRGKHFARGMCERCFQHQLSLEGLAEGDDPPAYKAALIKAEQAELQRMENENRGFLDDGEYEAEYNDYTQRLPLDDETNQIAQDMARALVGEHMGRYAKAFIPQDAAAATMALQREQTQEDLSGHRSPPLDEVSEPCLAIVPVTPAAFSGGQIVTFTGAVHEAANPSESEIAPFALVPAEPEDLVEPYEQDAGEEELSDLSDDEREYLCTEKESQAKKLCWDAANIEWLEKVRLKDEAAARQAEQAAQAAKDGQVPAKRSRGRPVGSRTRPVAEEYATPATTPAEAVKRMLASRKLSSKFNRDVVAKMYDHDDEEAQPPVVERQEPSKEPEQQRGEEGMEQEQGDEMSEEAAAHAAKLRQEESAKKRKAKAALYVEDVEEDPKSRRLGSLMNSPPKQRMRYRLGSLF